LLSLFYRAFKEHGKIEFLILKTAIKMNDIEQTRAFKILTIRNLDSIENKEVSKILSDFMTENKLESAQKGFEQIIKRYKRNLDWSDSKSKRDEETINFLREKNREMDKEIRECKKALSLFRDFLTSVSKLNF
jgi:hypothetical protein